MISFKITLGIRFPFNVSNISDRKLGYILLDITDTPPTLFEGIRLQCVWAHYKVCRNPVSWAHAVSQQFWCNLCRDWVKGNSVSSGSLRRFWVALAILYILPFSFFPFSPAFKQNSTISCLELVITSDKKECIRR